MYIYKETVQMRNLCPFVANFRIVYICFVSQTSARTVSLICIHNKHYLGTISW